MTGTRLTNLSRRDFGRVSMVALGGSLVGSSWEGNNEKLEAMEINGGVAPGIEPVEAAFAANEDYLAWEPPGCSGGPVLAEIRAKDREGAGAHEGHG